MHTRHRSKWDLVLQARTHRHPSRHPGHPPGGMVALSRRAFMGSAAGALGLGAALGAGLWPPARAAAQSSAEPVPIPGGSPGLGGTFHVFGPASPLGDPADAEPSTITDFFGSVGLAYLDGEVTRTDRASGEVVTLPFVNTDMRFMKGVFRGTDGQFHRGAFAFV